MKILTMTYNDFNRSLGDLGGNGESLEERGLLGTKTGVLSRNDDGAWRDGVGTGWRTHLVLQELVAHIDQVSASEDEPYVALDVRKQPTICQILEFIIKTDKP